MDANFRLQNKWVSSDLIDPGLNQGCGYMVKDAPYKEFLSSVPDKPSKVRIAYIWSSFISSIVLIPTRQAHAHRTRRYPLPTPRIVEDSDQRELEP